jgi:hypothetical protein
MRDPMVWVAVAGAARAVCELAATWLRRHRDHEVVVVLAGDADLTVLGRGHARSTDTAKAEEADERGGQVER